MLKKYYNRVINMKKVLLIINPHSGKLKSKSMLFDIINIMSQNDCLVTTRITAKSGDAVDFAREAAQCGEYDIVVCSGGDGTLSETMAGIVDGRGKVPLGYIPSGSTNDYAKSMGIPSDTKEAAELAVCGTEHAIDIGMIDGTYFDYVASFGAFTAASYSAPQTLKNLLGHMAYVLASIKDLANIKAIHIKVECEDNVYEDDYIFGAVTNSTSIGGIMHIDDELVKFNDGLFEVCLVKKPKNPADLTRIVMGALNSDFNSDCFEFFKASKMKFEMKEGIDWSLDGEKYEGKAVTNIEILKSAVNLKL